MTVRVTKPEINLREKLSELQRPIGLKGAELMSAETAQEARDLLNAGRRNILHNGEMNIKQRTANPVTGIQSEAIYLCDRWSFGVNAAGTWTASQETADPAPDHKNSYRVTLNTPSFDGTNGYVFLAQHVEGYNLAGLGYGTPEAEYTTVSFWVKSSQPGTYIVEFEHKGTAGNHSLSRSYTIDNADVWEYKTLTLPGHETKPFTFDNNRRLRLFFWIASGTTYAGGTLNTKWVAQVSGNRAAGLDNRVANNTNGYFEITGVQWEVGKNATDFERRSYAEELALCQRYYWIVPNSRWLNGYKRHDSYVFFQLDTPVPMRVSPTATILSVGLFTNHQSQLGGVVQTSGTSVFEYRPDSGRGVLQISSTYSGTHVWIPSWEAGTIEFNAEL